MRIREWAEREGFHPQTVWRWCREGTMPVPFERTATGAIIVHDPKYENVTPTTTAGRAVCYARVSSTDQKTDLQRQGDRLKAFAFNMGIDAPEVITEVGSGMNDKRRKLNKLLADPTVTTIIVEHRDRLASVNVELVESALEASKRRLIVVDDTELDDDLLRDMTEVLTSFCARLYDRKSSKRRAQQAVEALSR